MHIAYTVRMGSVALGVYIIAAAFGAIVGSFLNVVIRRYRTGASLAGRSRCPVCGHGLSWYALVPIVSYIALGGRCAACSSRISLQYPLIEGLAALSATGLVSALGIPETFAAAGVFALHALAVALLIIILGYDIRHTVIPDAFSYAFALVALLLLFIQWGGAPSGMALLAGPLLFAPFYVLWHISDGRWIGLGDGKLALGIGWFFGIAPGVSVLLIAVWVGAAVGVLLIGLGYLQRVQPQLFGRGKRRTIQSEIPFGPFIVLSALAHITLPIDALTLVALGTAVFA